METPSRHPLADLVQSLAGLHQETHQDLRAVREEQQKRFEALLQAQHEDRELFRSWMDREVQASPKPTSDSAATIALSKMGPMDDPEAFIDLFERSAAARDWPKEDWPMRLLPLLSGEAQVAAHQLPVKNLLVYDDLKRAILQRVGRTPEQHRQRFRTLALEESGRPFIFAHQLRDSCRKWLMAGECDAEGIIDRVVLEQFVARLPKKTAQWVQCHRPASLDQAIQLAEDQMVACHGVGEPLPAASLSLSSLSLSPPNPAPSLSKPVPAPRSRAGVPPRPAPRWRTGPAAETAATPRPAARGGGSLDPFPGSLSPSLSPRQGLDPLPATRAAGRPGPACWRCGDPGHFIDRCPMMEVGTLVRVPDAPQAAPDQAGLYQIPLAWRDGL
ncbi:putative SCAN domain-containing protein SCAND2P [Pseudorasbora parva]|uniref:putative SCAN domain-containing protein SCAND2P n=1 Tax=Pseudorasbora parva TaxID=51549 RepID=UPI00351EC63D